MQTIARLKKTDHTSCTRKDLPILKYPDISALRFPVFRSLHNDDDNFHFRVVTNYFYTTIIDRNEIKSGFRMQCQECGTVYLSRLLLKLQLAASNEPFEDCC